MSDAGIPCRDCGARDPLAALPPGRCAYCAAAQHSRRADLAKQRIDDARQRRQAMGHLGKVTPGYQRGAWSLSALWPTYEGYHLAQAYGATKYTYDEIIQALSDWMASDLRAQAALSTLSGTYVREPDSRAHDIARALTGWHLPWEPFAPEPPQRASGDCYPVWKWKTATQTNLRTARAVETWVKRHSEALVERRGEVLERFAVAAGSQAEGGV